MFENVDFKKGKILYIDDCKDLKEDLLQVQYANNYLLDVGWYGEENGFIIYIIKGYDWENPIRKDGSFNKKIMLSKLDKMINEVMILSKS